MVGKKLEAVKKNNAAKFIKPLIFASAFIIDFVERWVVLGEWFISWEGGWSLFQNCIAVWVALVW